MKTLLSTLVILVIVSPLYADAILLHEDFGASGTPAVGSSVAGYNGWTGDTNIVISDVIVDAGQSQGVTGSGTTWPEVSKGFVYTPGSGDTYALTATLGVPTTSDYAHVQIDDGSDTNRIAIAMGVSDLCFWADGYTWSDHAAYGSIVDVKVVLTDTTTAGYYRTHGTTDWTLVSSHASLHPLSTFNRVSLYSYAGHGGLTDSIQLSVSSVPEPSTIVFMFTGLFGLLAYAWRKGR